MQPRPAACAHKSQAADAMYHNSQERDGYHFESGPSLYSGMDARGVAANPLAHVFQVRTSL